MHFPSGQEHPTKRRRLSPKTNLAAQGENLEQDDEQADKAVKMQQKRKIEPKHEKKVAWPIQLEVKKEILRMKMEPKAKVVMKREAKQGDQPLFKHERRTMAGLLTKRCLITQSMRKKGNSFTRRRHWKKIADNDAKIAGQILLDRNKEAEEEVIADAQTEHEKAAAEEKVFDNGKTMEGERGSKIPRLRTARCLITQSRRKMKKGMPEEKVADKEAATESECADNGKVEDVLSELNVS